MGKQQDSGIPPFIQVNATTTGPRFVSSAITPDIRYEAKTTLAVLAESKDGTLTASVFRESSKVRGQFTRDMYTWSGKDWKNCGKDQQKYPTSPFPPAGAIRTLIEGVEVFTMQPLTTEEENRLCLLIAVLPKG